MSDENCVQVILFYGNKGKLVLKMAEICGCTPEKAEEFIKEYFHFLTKEMLQKLEDEIKPDCGVPLVNDPDEIVPENESESESESESE